MKWLKKEYEIFLIPFFAIRYIGYDARRIREEVVKWTEEISNMYPDQFEDPIQRKDPSGPISNDNLGRKVNRQKSKKETSKLLPPSSIK